MKEEFMIAGLIRVKRETRHTSGGTVMLPNSIRIEFPFSECNSLISAPNEIKYEKMTVPGGTLMIPNKKLSDPARASERCLVIDLIKTQLASQNIRQIKRANPTDGYMTFSGAVSDEFLASLNGGVDLVMTCSVCRQLYRQYQKTK